jgi:ribosome-associated protein
MDSTPQIADGEASLPDVVTIARQIVEDKMGTDIVLLDVRGRCAVSDYFLIATGTSPPHLKALRDALLRGLKDAGISNFKHAGGADGGWIVLDYLDVIIHIFQAETRAFYALETLWETPPPA